MKEDTFMRLLAVKKRLPLYFEGAVSIIESDMKNGNVIGRTVYDFSDDGFLSQEKYFDSDNQLKFVALWSYSERDESGGFCSFKKELFWRDSGKRHRVEYRFDSENNVINEEKYQNDMVAFRGLYSLDPINLRCVKYQNSRNESYEQYKYDDSGNLVRVEKIVSQGITVGVDKMSYNEFGDCIVVRNFSESGLALTEEVESTYEYDFRNNWIRKKDAIVEYEKGTSLGKAFTEKTREICYQTEIPVVQASV